MEYVCVFVQVLLHSKLWRFHLCKFHAKCAAALYTCIVAVVGVMEIWLFRKVLFTDWQSKPST